jgi:hypothetical protein
MTFGLCEKYVYLDCPLDNWHAVSNITLQNTIQPTSRKVFRSCVGMTASSVYMTQGQEAADLQQTWRGMRIGNLEWSNTILLLGLGVNNTLTLCGQIFQRLPVSVLTSQQTALLILICHGIYCMTLVHFMRKMLATFFMNRLYQNLDFIVTEK